MKQVESSKVQSNILVQTFFTRLLSLSMNLRTSKHAVYKINSVDEKRSTNGFSSSAYILGSVSAMKTPKVPVDS